MSASLRHGTYKGYARMGCRCSKCRAYQNERVRRSRAERLAAGRLNHGNAGWDDGCRCDICRTASTERRRDYERRMTTAEEWNEVSS